MNLSHKAELHKLIKKFWLYKIYLLKGETCFIENVESFLHQQNIME